MGELLVWIVMIVLVWAGTYAWCWAMNRLFDEWVECPEQNESVRPILGNT